MKKYPHLWETIEEQNNIETVRKDWSEGKVPDLPFAVVGQKQVKEHIRQKLLAIDGDRMQTSILTAQYGDGKTNVFKYLELYFRKYNDLGVHFVYCRANQDQTDLCMFLMQHIQASFFEDLVSQVKILSLQAGFNPASMANNFDGDFAFIKEYTQKLFDKDNQDSTIGNLIYLGTGRLYSQAMFSKFGLEKLTDFNRREVFVLFMNILANAGIYVVFAIDELEKINDKSSKRMSHYFTSYRELLDLFNKIKGHYLMTAITNAVDIASLNQPFSERVKQDMIGINLITDANDLNELIALMSYLLEIHLDEANKKKISDKAKRASKDPNINNNRRLIQLISETIKNIDYKPMETVKDKLKEFVGLNELYEETSQRLNSEDAFANLPRALFDPLEYYLIALGYNVNDKSNNYRRDYQAIVDNDSKRAFFFLFNDDSKIKSRIEEFVSDKGYNDFVVFTKKELSITYSQLQIKNATVKIVEYDPEELFILLNMYRWNFDKQKEISVVLRLATSNIFE